MKKIITSIFFAILFYQTTFGQATEGEDKLRTQTSDTTQGWRKGGVAVLNLSQTSLTNWASGGQNSISVNGLLSVFANYKKINLFGIIHWMLATDFFARGKMLPS